MQRIELLKAFVYIDSSGKLETCFLKRLIFLVMCATVSEIPSNESTAGKTVTGTRKERVNCKFNVNGILTVSQFYSYHFFGNEYSHETT